MVVIEGVFTGQSNALCNHVVSVIYVRFCLEALSDCWLTATKTLGMSLGKELWRGSNLGCSICTVAIRLKKKKNPTHDNLASPQSNIHHCTEPLEPSQGHVPTGTSMRTTLHGAGAGHSKRLQ